MWAERERNIVGALSTSLGHTQVHTDWRVPSRRSFVERWSLWNISKSKQTGHIGATSGIAPSFKFERMWSDFTRAEWNFRRVESGLWAERSGMTLSEGAKTHVSMEHKFSPLSSTHMLWPLCYLYVTDRCSVSCVSGGSDVLVLPSGAACRVLACLQCSDWSAAGPIGYLPSVHGPWDPQPAEAQRLLTRPAGVQAAVRHRVGTLETLSEREVLTVIPITNFKPQTE